MRKPKYNQGDVLQYHWPQGCAQLIVILEVSNNYKTFWINPNDSQSMKPSGKNTQDIMILDRSTRITLLARGSNET